MKQFAFFACLLTLVAITLSGCVMAGELRRCYGVALPFVKVGVCERL